MNRESIRLAVLIAVVVGASLLSCAAGYYYSQNIWQKFIRIYALKQINIALTAQVKSGSKPEELHDLLNTIIDSNLHWIIQYRNVDLGAENDPFKYIVLGRLKEYWDLSPPYAGPGFKDLRETQNWKTIEQENHDFLAEVYPVYVEKYKTKETKGDASQ